MRRRSGFTLIELIVAMSLFAVIVPMAGWMVYVLLRAQTASADSLADAMTLSLLARTFRADAHGAQSVEIDSGRSPAGERAVFRLDSPRTISYAAEGGGVIVRTVENGSRIERREEFRLTGTQTRFERTAKEGTVAAVHKPRAFAISGAPVVTSAASTIRIEAVVGRDRRFEKSPKGRSKEPPPPALPRRPGEKRKSS